MSENDAILKVNGLKTYFYQASGVSKAVDGVSFTLKEGTTMGIVGESGSGKSVTSASVMRLMPAKTGKIVDGSIIFDGVDIRSLSESQMEKFRGDECCMIFQNPMTSLDPVFKIGHQASQCIFTFRDSKFISDRHPDSRCDLCHNSDILIRQRFPYRINILPDTDRTGRTDRPALSAAYAVSLCQLSVKCRHNLHF